MTRNRRVSKKKILFTVMQIAVFLGLIVYADVFGTSSDRFFGEVNPNFVGGSDQVGVGIDPDNINITDNGEDVSVISYIVQEGDNLEKISKEFGVPVKDLKRLNKIGDVIKPGQKLVVSSDEDGILYVVQKERSLKLFAEFYRLDIKDLMTFNYISDDSEMLYPGQELFINVTEQRAYDIGLLEKPQPVLPKDEKPRPKVVPKRPKASKPASSSKVAATSTSSVAVQKTAGKKSRVIKQRYYNPKVSNGFAVGYCTWYAAMQTPGIFEYTSDTKQSRPFGGNARNRYVNAKKAGIAVGQTPRVGAIIVYSNLRSSAGHVGIVKAYYPESGEMIIEDMNYVGKYIVTQRRENVSRDGIIGYIYP